MEVCRAKKCPAVLRYGQTVAGENIVNVLHVVLLFEKWV
jgi:hypothetical protein